MTRAQLKTHAPQAEAKPRKPRWKVVVDNTADRNGPTPDHLPLDKLREGVDFDPAPLPYRDKLETAFGRDLGFAKVAKGPSIDAALWAEDALAANRDDILFLPDQATLGLVAHEVMHLLQRHGFVPVNSDTAEHEARIAEARAEAGLQIPEVAARPADQATAFRRPDDLSEAQITTEDPDEARAVFDAAVTETDAVDRARPEPTAPDERPALETPNLGPDVDDAPVPTFDLPPEPELDIDEAAAAQAQAEAETAFANAEDADALMTALRDAPPSIKAVKQATLETDTAQLATKEQAQFDADMPEFEAKMSGEDDLADPQAVVPPGTAPAALEDGTPAPAPEPEVDPTPDPGFAELNEAVETLLSLFFGGGGASELGRAFSNVKTKDQEVETSAGERPKVPLEGETDPQRVTDQDAAARTDAVAKRDEATQSVLNGRGPEQVQLQEMAESFWAEPREMPEITGSAEASAGADEFAQKELGADVVALFDQHHAGPMAESMQTAKDEMDTAVADRNAGRDQELADAEAERSRLNAAADEEQRDEVMARRQDIQDARQTAVDDQARHVADLEAQADLDRNAAQDEIETEVSTTETSVQTRFDQAESDAEDKVAEGDRKAEAERRKSERESKNKSWWERAAGWVADQFEKLTSLINDIFDAVRSAVKGIIDAAKSFALRVIDAAAKVIKAAIRVFATALKAAVNALLSEHFPAVAEALNSAIDKGVELAERAVDAVAERLKAGITALLDALAAGLDAILGAFQAAVNTALEIARAVVTGDWDALAKLVLEPILRLLGIDPAEFYQTMARIGEALGLIVDHPLDFLSNLVGAVTGGIGKFADNFLTHLQAGIIGWLTGALGDGITLPDRWDLWGLLDLGRQILGLTLDMVRRVAVRILGEDAVEKVEFFMGYAAELISGGWSALWEKIQQDLGQLADTVLGQIKEFLMERIVMASITWLASLFNPVGALIKLVMTIWNFIMFLKDQLVRIFDVARTVINTMWEIATGVLEPAMQGVENVLSRLLPIAIDLLARLLGLGNVAGRVQRIIGDIRQSIEDAIVNLIRRVLARFTGGRRGQSDGQQGDETDSTTDLMPMIPFSGGGENHRLYIEEQGDNAVPMMRSTPMPVESWLVGLRGAGLDRIGNDKSPKWTPEQIAEKRTEIAPLLDQALGKEAELDREGDDANRREDAAPEGQDVPPSPQLQATGEELAGILSQILEKLDLSARGMLNEVFADDLAALDADVRQQVHRNVLPRLDAARYGTVTWAQAIGMIAAESDLTVSLRTPLATPGIVRRTQGGLRETYITRVIEIIEDKYPESLDGGSDLDTLNDFFADYLSADVNTDDIRAEVLDIVLKPNATGEAVANAIKTKIENAAKRKFGNAVSYDHAFKTVTGSYYRDTILTDPGKVLRNAAFGTYFDDEAENAAGAGAGGVEKPFPFFVKDETRGGTKRYAANRGRLADAVRAARPGYHEWIPASKAASILSVTADRLDADGDLDPLIGAAKILNFQDTVRTPTYNLLFKPDAALNHIAKEIRFVSKKHGEFGKPFDELTDDEKDQAYPQGGPQHGQMVRVIQGHAGGLYSGKIDGGELKRGRNMQWSSPDWHAKLATNLLQPLEDNLASNGDGTTIRDAITDFYEDTIWQGSKELPGDPKYDLYFTSGHEDALTYDDLKAHAQSVYDSSVPALTDDVEEALT